MKKLVLFVSLTCSYIGAFAQQDAQYTQFFFNRLNYNPAYAGTEDKICATLFGRTQWVGFGNNTLGLAPRTWGGNIHSPLGSNFGIGLQIANDELGFERSLNPILSLSYRYTLSNGSVISAGLGGGIMQKTVAGDKYDPTDPGDPFIPTTNVSGIAPDFNAGLYYMQPNLWRFTNFYAGASATHLNQGVVEYNAGRNKTPMNLHTYFMTGASYDLLPFLALQPNLFLKTDFAKTSFDFNIMALYNDKIMGGLTYRTIDAVSILAGYKILPKLQVMYSYDLTTSQIARASDGSHEISLRYCFMPNLKPKPVIEPIPRLTPRFL